MKIYKYAVEPFCTTTVELPAYANVLSVLAKDGRVWVYVDRKEELSDGRTRTAIFAVYPTGDSEGLLKGFEPVVFLGSVVSSNGMFVWHVFEVIPT